MHGRQDDQVCCGPSSMIGGVILIIHFQFISSAQRGTLPLDLLLAHAARPFLYYYLSRRTGFRDSTRRLHHHFANRTLSNHTIRYLLPLSFLIVPVRTYQSSLLFRVGVKSRLCRSSPIFKNCVLSFPSPPFATLDHHLFGHTLDLEHGYRHIDHIHDMMTW